MAAMDTSASMPSLKALDSPRKLPPLEESASRPASLAGEHDLAQPEPEELSPWQEFCVKLEKAILPGTGQEAVVEFAQRVTCMGEFVIGDPELESKARDWMARLHTASVVKAEAETRHRSAWRAGRETQMEVDRRMAVLRATDRNAWKVWGQAHPLTTHKFWMDNRHRTAKESWECVLGAQATVQQVAIPTLVKVESLSLQRYGQLVTECKGKEDVRACNPELAVKQIIAIVAVAEMDTVGHVCIRHDAPIVLQLMLDNGLDFLNRNIDGLNMLQLSKALVPSHDYTTATHTMLQDLVMVPFHAMIQTGARPPDVEEAMVLSGLPVRDAKLWVSAQERTFVGVAMKMRKEKKKLEQAAAVGLAPGKKVDSKEVDSAVTANAKNGLPGFGWDAKWSRWEIGEYCPRPPDMKLCTSSFRFVTSADRVKLPATLVITEHQAARYEREVNAADRLVAGDVDGPPGILDITDSTLVPHILDVCIAMSGLRAQLQGMGPRAAAKRAALPSLVNNSAHFVPMMSVVSMTDLRHFRRLPRSSDGIGTVVTDIPMDAFVIYISYAWFRPMLPHPDDPGETHFRAPLHLPNPLTTSVLFGVLVQTTVCTRRF
jgi:hypothetical protein